MKKHMLARLIIPGLLGFCFALPAFASSTHSISHFKQEQNQIHAAVNHMSASQKARYHKVVESYQRRSLPVMKKLRAKYSMLNAQLLQPKIHDKEVRRLVPQVNKLRSELFTIRIDTQLKLARETGKRFPLLPPSRMVK